MLKPYKVIGLKHLIAADFGGKKDEDPMTTRDKRKHVRIKQFFRTELSQDGTSHSIEGQTKNVSQRGAFIKTKDWHSFKPNDKTTLTVYLPPIFSGPDGTIGLQGSAVINRVDE